MRATGGIIGDLLLAEGAGTGLRLFFRLLGKAGLFGSKLLELSRGVHGFDDGKDRKRGDEEADDVAYEGAKVELLATTVQA